MASSLIKRSLSFCSCRSRRAVNGDFTSAFWWVRPRAIARAPHIQLYERRVGKRSMLRSKVRRSRRPNPAHGRRAGPYLPHPRIHIGARLYILALVGRVRTPEPRTPHHAHLNQPHHAAQACSPAQPGAAIRPAAPLARRRQADRQARTPGKADRGTHLELTWNAAQRGTIAGEPSCAAGPVR